ncbi:ankyrin repeat-containing domain protein [Mycena floridula]|nr:ankyrin repeat-containing domain protein [Mycena floridula]
MGSIPRSNVKLSTYASGSSVHFHADHFAGNVEGSVLSHNNIRFDADPAVRQRVDNLIEHVIDTKRIEKRKEFLDWISKLDFQATQIETFAKHAPGTGDWFFKKPEFIDWREGKTKFLWCPGIPGAGKTILSSIIIDHLRSISSPAPAVLYIYCDYTRQSDQTPIQLLGSILKQLVQYHPCISDHLLDLHHSHSSQTTFPDVGELFTALQTEASFHECVYIIVDALDECSEDNQTRELFFPTNSQGILSLPDHVHLLITSRDIFSIAQEYHDEPKIPIEAHQEDLQTYIKGRIITDIKLKRLVKGDITLEAEIVDQVIFKAAGMFLQARLHLDSLASQLNRKTLRKALSSLPKGIMDSYDTAVARINAQGEAEYKLALQVFYWLAYAQRSLSVIELQHAIAVSAGMTEMDLDAIVDVDILTGICAGLVIVKEESFYSFDANMKDIIQLVHYTTQEYFESKQQELFPDIHSSMAITCLTYLSFDIFNTKGIDEVIWELHPLYTYAANHWGEHARRDEVAVVQHTLKFLEKKENILHASSGSHHPIRSPTNFMYWPGRVMQWSAILWPTIGKPHILAWLGLHHTLKTMSKDDIDIFDNHGCTPLYYAYQYGHASVVKRLLEKGVDPNMQSIMESSQTYGTISPSQTDSDGLPPLHYAIVKGNIDIVTLLLECGKVDPNSTDCYKNTPLHLAMKRPNPNINDLYFDRVNIDQPNRTGIQGVQLNIVKTLLTRTDIDPNARNKDSVTPLLYAVGMGDFDLVKLLLQRTDIDSIASDVDQRTPLSYAAEHGHIDIIKLLLQQQSVDPFAGDKDQRTPLSYAADKGHINVVELFLQLQDLIVSDKNQRSPLSYAAARGHTAVVQVLLNQISDLNTPDTNLRTPLSYAAARDYLDTVKFLLEQQGIKPDVWDRDQCTPLAYAADRGHFDIVELLLNREDVDPNAYDLDQCSPLAYAADRGHLDIVKLFLKHKDVNLNMKESDQCSPLAYAAARGHSSIVKLFLEQEDINPNGSTKKPPLTAAAAHGHFEVVKHLLRHKSINPNTSDKDQRTALSYAAQQGHIDIVDCLLGLEDVDPNVSDTDQCTPLAYAANWGHTEIVKLLLSREDIDPLASDQYQRTPLSYAAEWGHFDVVQLLLNHSNPLSAEKALFIVRSIDPQEEPYCYEDASNYPKIIEVLQEYCAHNGLV